MEIIETGYCHDYERECTTYYYTVRGDVRATLADEINAENGSAPSLNLYNWNNGEKTFDCVEVLPDLDLKGNTVVVQDVWYNY